MQPFHPCFINKETEPHRGHLLALTSEPGRVEADLNPGLYNSRARTLGPQAVLCLDSLLFFGAIPQSIENFKSNPGSLQWNHGALTTGLPGKFLGLIAMHKLTIHPCLPSHNTDFTKASQRRCHLT